VTARTWRGNQGNNLATNPNNWDPTGAPQPGDMLSALGNVTMDIADNALQGDTLTLRNGAATLNLTQNGSVDLSWSNSLRPPAAFDRVASVTVNVKGNGTLKARGFVNPGGGPTDVTVNLSDASNSQLFGSFNLSTGTLKINGGDKSKLVNDSTTTLNGVRTTITHQSII